jgi:peptidoglycan hydrolase CwlO-like protein
VETLIARQRKAEESLRAELLEERATVVAAKDSQILSLSNQCRSARGEIDTLKKELGECQAQCAEAKSLNSTMSRIVEKTTTSADGVSTSLRDEMESSRKKDIDIAKLNCTIASLQEEVSRLQQEGRKVSIQHTATLCRMEATAQSLQSDLSSTRNDCRKTIQELGNTRLEIQRLNSVAAESIRRALFSEEIAIRGNLEALAMFERPVFSGVMRRLCNQAVESSHRIQRLTLELSDAREVETALRNELTSMTSQALSASEKGAVLTKDLEAANDSIKQLRGAVADASRALTTETTAHKKATCTAEALRLENVSLHSIAHDHTVGQKTNQERSLEIRALDRRVLELSEGTARGQLQRELLSEAYTEIILAGYGLLDVLDIMSHRRISADEEAERLRSVAAAALTERHVFAERCGAIQEAYTAESQQIAAETKALAQQREEWAADRRRLITQVSGMAQDQKELQEALDKAQEKNLLSQLASNGFCGQCASYRVTTDKLHTRVRELEEHVGLLTESFKGLEDIVGGIAEATLRKAKGVLSLPGVALKKEDTLEAKIHVLNTCVDVAVGTLSASRALKDNSNSTTTTRVQSSAPRSNRSGKP